MSAKSITKSLAQLGLQAEDSRILDVTGVSVDSRLVRPGHLFVALSGAKIHGAEFITYALRMQATAVLTDAQGAEIARETLSKYDPALIIREDARMALAFAASNWFGAQPEKMIAVTGTNGKTSVANFTRQIWSQLGYNAVNFGTAGVEGAVSATLSHTTPEPVTLHALLAELAREGVTHGAMEASSHGLEQRRLDGVELTAAAFTNFSQDHLDYHETFEEYFDAKSALFTRVLPDRSTAVINMDDLKGAEIAKVSQAYGHRLILVGQKDRYDICLKSRQYDSRGQNVLFTWLGESFSTRLDLIGGFQAQNVLLAAGLAIATGAEPRDVFATLEELKTVRGRMQHAATRKNGAAIFVDYAHTPDAISTAIQAMRPHVMGRIIAVIGAGGDRDTTKRKLMGQAAREHADVVFVTDDNPRSEDPALIRQMVMEGCPDATNVGDRAEAILRAVDALEAGDALLIAGKGHETGQVVGDDILPFDDVEQASLSVAALEGQMG